MKAVFAALAFVLGMGASAAYGETAVLRGLDKVTGHARDFNAVIGRPVRFGSLEIVARSCAKRPAEETPEVSIFVEVYDTPTPAEGQEPQRQEIFSGWMFASSPGLSALNHAVYDIWAIDCRA